MTEQTVGERVKARARSLQDAGIPTQAFAVTAGLVLVVGAGFGAASIGGAEPFAARAESGISSMQPIAAPEKPTGEAVGAAEDALEQANLTAAKKLRQLKANRRTAAVAARVPHENDRTAAQKAAVRFRATAASKDKAVSRFQTEIDNWAKTRQQRGQTAYTAKTASCLSENQVAAGGLPGGANKAVPKPDPNRVTQVQVNKKCAEDAETAEEAAVKKADSEELPLLLANKAAALKAAKDAGTNATTEDGKAETARKAADAAAKAVPAVEDPAPADTKPAVELVKSEKDRYDTDLQQFNTDSETVGKRQQEQQAAAETLRNQGELYDNGLHAVLWILSGAAFLSGLWLLAVLARVWPRPGNDDDQDDDGDGYSYPADQDPNNPATIPIPVLRESVL